MDSTDLKQPLKFNPLCGCIAVFFSFTCIFSICISSYLSGVEDFWFRIKDFIFPLSIISIIATLIVYVFCIWKPQFFIPLFFGLSFCAYLQLNFLNADYGLIDGHNIEWSSYGLYGTVNLCIWLLFIVAIIFMFRLPIVKKAYFYVSLLLCGMQVAGLAGEFILAPEKKNELVLTNAGINEIGSGKNLVLIILDTFDVRHVQYLLDTEHPICKYLDGFTFYDNAVSPYPKTLTSVPFMLTGRIYKNDTNYEEFLYEQYTHSELINQLYNKGYDIGLFTNIDESIDAFEGKIRNIQTSNELQPRPSSTWDVWFHLMRYGLFREIPHTFKKYVPISINDFNNLKDQSDDNVSIYVTNDTAYYQHLKNNGLKVIPDSSTFRLIHLNGMHEPLTLTSDVRQIKESTVYEQLNGTMEILREYLEALRTAGVYDQTAVMVLGDHGAILGNQPALLYKPIGASGTLQISDAAVYFEDIHKTLLNEIDLDVDYGENITVLSSTDRERMFYDYRINDPAPEGFFPDMWEAVYTADNNIPHFTGNIYRPHEEVTYLEYANPLKLGEEIAMDNMRNYFNSNFLSWGEDDYIWGKGLESIMLFRLDSIPNTDIVVTLNFIPWIDSDSKPLTITLMDGTSIYEDTYHRENDEPYFVFTIPADAFDDNGAIALRMKWSDDNSALTENNSDLRQKQIGLKSFQVTLKN